MVIEQTDWMAQNGVFTQARVSDNRVGFPPENADRLFGVFQRLHHAEEFEGAGLGLAIVQRIAQRHGAQVGAEGRVNGGATFYFTLPKQTKTP